MSNVMFHVGSRADYHLFKHVAADLAARRHNVALAVPDGELLSTLPPIPHAPLIVAGAARSGTGDEVVQALRLQVRFLTVIRLQRPDLLVGSGPEVVATARLVGIPCVVVSDRDAGVDPDGCAASHACAQVILSPEFCGPGQWGRKTIQFAGFPTLAYLHPRRFVPPKLVHDDLRRGARASVLVVGCSANTQLLMVARRLIATLSPGTAVHIAADNSVSAISHDLARHALPAGISVHGAMAHAALVVSDDPRRVEESAVLGTPAVWLNRKRHSSAVRQLESRYGLSMSAEPIPDGVASIAQCVLNAADRGKRAFQARRQRLLADAVDVTAFLSTSIEKSCQSAVRRVVSPGYRSAHWK